MTRMLLGFAAGIVMLVASAAPATAENGVRVHFGNGDGPGHNGDGHHGRRNDLGGFRDGHRQARGDATVISEWYGGQWALYNNRSFAPDSYNDWWHDNPQRSYPRWVQNNQNCDRQWWGGGTWRC